MNVKIGYCVFDYKRGWIKQTNNQLLDFTMQFNLAIVSVEASPVGQTKYPDDQNTCFCQKCFLNSVS